MGWARAGLLLAGFIGKCVAEEEVQEKIQEKEKEEEEEVQEKEKVRRRRRRTRVLTEIEPIGVSVEITK